MAAGAVWLLGVGGSTSAVTPEDWRIRLERAARHYDLEATLAVLSQARAEGASDPKLQPLLVEAGLQAAELLRLEHEQTPKRERGRRRRLGQQIDAIAKEAIERLETLAESSQRARQMADLLATLIRSDFRAKRHQDALRQAVARALELDERNARAWVSAAKPYLFAQRPPLDLLNPRQTGSIARQWLTPFRLLPTLDGRAV